MVMMGKFCCDCDPIKNPIAYRLTKLEQLQMILLTVRSYM